MNKFLFLIFSSFIFFSCSDINPASNQTLHYSSEDFSATLTTTGYGKNSTLLPSYSKGNFSSVFQDNSSYFLAKTNTTDSTGSQSNSFTVTIQFPHPVIITSLQTEFDTNSESSPSFSVKKIAGETTTTVTTAWSSSQTISINDAVEKLEVSITLNKYTNNIKNNYYLKLIKIIPQF